MGGLLFRVSVGTQLSGAQNRFALVPNGFPYNLRKYYAGLGMGIKPYNLRKYYAGLGMGIKKPQQGLGLVVV